MYGLDLKILASSVVFFFFLLIVLFFMKVHCSSRAGEEVHEQEKKKLPRITDLEHGFGVTEETNHHRSRRSSFQKCHLFYLKDSACIFFFCSSPTGPGTIKLRIPAPTMLFFNAKTSILFKTEGPVTRKNSIALSMFYYKLLWHIRLRRSASASLLSL